MSFSLTALFANMIAAATPLALAGIGGLFGERSGITNIGLEGNMLFSAFFAVFGSYITGNPWVGLLFGALMGVFISLIHAYFCITLKINHSVIGLAINILASSITVFLCDIVFGNKGFSENVVKVPSVDIPLLSNIPLIGEIFQNISVFFIIAVIFAAIGTYLLFYTKFGLHVISVGESPHAAHVLGLSVKRTQYISVMIGGLCCGLAGGYLSISYLSMFVRDMVAGRGFIAIAAILFGRYHPVGVFAAAMFFGLAEALQITLQGTVQIPNEIIQSIPYILTILAICFSEIRARRKKLVKA